MTYPQEVFTVFAFLGFLLSVIPFSWQLEAWNTGACLFMIWTAVGCLNLFVNSIIWRSNAINLAPVWCDISSRIIISNFVAIPAASLCMNRRLYHIASIKSVNKTKTRMEKRRNVIVDLSIGLGIPFFFQGFYYINQGHRFNIFEDVGCWPYVHNTWVSYVLMSTPPLVIGLISGFYATLSLLAFNKSRNQFNEFLSEHTNLSSSRYFRLMCLAGIEILCTIPLSIAFIILNTKAGLRPWISWENVHSNFSRVHLLPAMMWRSKPVGEIQLEFTRWMTVVCAFIFFGFFGFADEARSHYYLAFIFITKTLGITLTSSSSGGVLSPEVVSSAHLRSDVPFPREHGRDNRDSMVSVDASFKDGWKTSTFATTWSSGVVTLNDVGGTLSLVGATPLDYSESPLPVPSLSTLSPTSTPNILRNSTAPIPPVVDTSDVV